MNNDLEISCFVLISGIHRGGYAAQIAWRSL